MKTKEIDINKIIPYVNNPRKNENAIDHVAASIKEFGWQQPIVVDKEMTIIVGHTRYQAAKRLGLSVVPIVVADNLSNSQVKAYRIADNRVSEFSDWDLELLKIELDAILDDNIDGTITGFSEEEIENLLKEISLDDFFEKSKESEADEEDNENEEDVDDEEQKETMICPHCKKQITL